MDNKTVGRIGEDLATRYLVSQNYRIVCRNFRAKQYGEVDIIAQKRDLLVFVEVKTRIGNQFGSPEEAITFKKLRELKRMANYYFNLHPNPKLSPQIDAIAVTLGIDGSPIKLNHLPNITL